MKKRFESKYYILIWATLVAIVNVILFLSIKAENRQTAFWVSYGFIMGAFLCNLVGFLVTPRNSERINTVTTFSFVFLVVCILIGIIFFFLPKAKFIVVFLPYFIVTGLFIIMIVFGAMNQAWIKNNPQKLPEIFTMEQLVSYLQNLQNKCTDVAVRNGINELATLAMNALPNEAHKTEVEMIEKQIFEYTTFLRKNVEQGEITNIFHNIEKVKKLFKEREDKLM